MLIKLNKDKYLKINIFPLIKIIIFAALLYFYPEVTIGFILISGAVSTLMKNYNIRLTMELGMRLAFKGVQLLLLIAMFECTRTAFKEIPGGTFGFISDEIVGGCTIPDGSSASLGRLTLNYGGGGADFSEGKMNRSPLIKDLWSPNSLACPARAMERIQRFGFDEVELSIVNKDPQTITRKVISAKRRLHFQSSTLEDPLLDDNPPPAASPQDQVKIDTSRSSGGSGIKALVLIGAAAVYGGYCYYTGKPVLPQGWWWKEIPNQNQNVY
jgi:hypothetical protein